MTTTVNCDTCDHRIVCQFAAEANELKKRIRDDLPPAVQGDNILPALHLSLCHTHHPRHGATQRRRCIYDSDLTGGLTNER